MSDETTADHLVARLGRADAPLVLDVRSAAEYAAGHVPGAVNIPFWAVPWRAPDLSVPRDHPIVVYCGHGPRAGMARGFLRARGFTNVACLAGHWVGWLRRKLPTSNLKS